MSSELYYLIDSRQRVGNCLLFWKDLGQGYTTNILEAQKFTAPDVSHRYLPPLRDDLEENDLRAVRCDLIQAIAKPRVDHQDLDHLESNLAASLTVVEGGKP